MCKTVIYGAQGVALSVYRALQVTKPELKIDCFLVTEMGINAPTLAGLPVIETDKYISNMTDEQKADLVILIAVPEQVMGEIEIYLDERNLKNHKRIDSLAFGDIMERFCCESDMFHALSESRNQNSTSDLSEECGPVNLMVYMAKHHKDRPLSRTYDIPDWNTPIQVGAALTDVSICDVRDDSFADNISVKNVNYSELTALYWLWKTKLEAPGDDRRYYGLAHYRRMLNLKKEDLSSLITEDVDVVLPYPMIYEPDIAVHHERYLSDTDWKAVETAISEICPVYSEALQKTMNQPYMYNYNIIVAKKNVLRDYCRWLFAILERVEELSIPRGDERADRYIGYIGENLETVYFMSNADKLNIRSHGHLFCI